MATSVRSRAGASLPPARRAGAALDEHSTVGMLLAGHRRAQGCFMHVRPLLADTLADLVRPGPIDDGTWTLFAEHASAAAKLRQSLPELLAAVAAADPSITAVRVKIVPRGG